MLLLCKIEMRDDKSSIPKNIEKIVKSLDFIEGLLVTYIMKDVVIKISDNLIMPKNSIFTGTVRTDKQKSKYTILLIVLSLLILFMVYFRGSLEALKKQ